MYTPQDTLNQILSITQNAVQAQGSGTYSTSSIMIGGLPATGIFVSAGLHKNVDTYVFGKDKDVYNISVYYDTNGTSTSDSLEASNLNLANKIIGTFKTQL